MHQEETLTKLNMSFLIKDDELLEKYNAIWEKVRNSIKKEFDSKQIVKSYNGKITYFQNNKIAKEGSQYICLSVILINSVFRTGKNYYPQVFVEEFKYAVKRKYKREYMTNNIEISSDSD